MKKLLAIVLVACATIANTRSMPGQVVNGVFSQQEAQRHGLVREWFAQADVDGVRGKIVDMVLNDGTLFVQTSRATLQAINAETGQTLWSAAVGNERWPCMAPAANAEYVAAINGSTLYLLDRKTGLEKWSRRLDNVPGAGPSLSRSHVFVPTVKGTLYGFELKNRKATPWRYTSFGRILVQPVVSADTLSWTTEKGYLYLMRIDNPEQLIVNYRLTTNDKIESRPGYWTPYLYGTSLDGYAYAVNELTGKIDWKYSTAEPLVEAPVAVNGKLYVCVENGGMYCLNGATGEAEWYAPGLIQFVSISPTRVYATDRLNNLNILDAKTGARLDSVPIHGVTGKMRNMQSDRIFLSTERGVIQCLHETELVKPVTYTPPLLQPKEKPKTKQKKLGDDEVAADDEEIPAKPAKKPAKAAADEADAEDAFGSGDEPAAEEAGDEDMKAEAGDEKTDEEDPFK